jgi:hypothetical protein
MIASGISSWSAPASLLAAAVHGVSEGLDVLVQARKFGAEIRNAFSAVRLSCDRRPYAIDYAAEKRYRVAEIIVVGGAIPRDSRQPIRNRTKSAERSLATQGATPHPSCRFGPPRLDLFHFQSDVRG